MEFNALSGILMFHCCQRSRKVASATNRKALPFDFAILLLSNLFNILGIEKILMQRQMHKIVMYRVVQIFYLGNT